MWIQRQKTNSTKVILKRFLITDLVCTNFDRMCEKIALNVVRQETKPTSRRGKRRTTNCPECKMSFPVSNPADRKKFEAHKLIHVGCSCKVQMSLSGNFSCWYLILLFLFITYYIKVCVWNGAHSWTLFQITFDTDAQYRAHMKSVHLQKKPFK